MTEYINREAAIRALLNDAPEQVSYSREDAADCICYMDAADVAPVVHAHWEYLGEDEWWCSACGFVITTEGSWDKPIKRYCEDCGARMDEME